MIVNALGVVLERRDWREADRLCFLYTEVFGKIAVRFTGVQRPGRKLKALSEPLAWGEFRLHLSPRSETAKAVGGQLLTVFPRIREDLGRTVVALRLLESLSNMTVSRSPNPAKYHLLCEALSALERGAGPWLEAAYGLRLLGFSGYGPSPPAGFSPGLWRVLREAPFGALAEVPADPEAEGALRGYVMDQIEAHAGRALRSRDFAGRLSRGEPAPC